MGYRTCKSFLIVRKQLSCYLRGNAVHYVAFIFLSKRAQDMSDRFCGEEAKAVEEVGMEGRERKKIHKSILPFAKKLPNLRRNQITTNTAICQHITTFSGSEILIYMIVPRYLPSACYCKLIIIDSM